MVTEGFTGEMKRTIRIIGYRLLLHQKQMISLFKGAQVSTTGLKP